MSDTEKNYKATESNTERRQRIKQSESNKLLRGLIQKEQHSKNNGDRYIKEALRAIQNIINTETRERYRSILSLDRRLKKYTKC